MTTRILVLPSRAIYWNPSKVNINLRNKINTLLRDYVPNVFETLKTPRNLRKGSIVDYLSLRMKNFPLPGNDLAWWGRLNEIEGIEVLLLGNPNKSYFEEEKISEASERWPVLFGFKSIDTISQESALQTLTKFDYILCSSRFENKYLNILEKASKVNIPIAIIDAFDDEPVYEQGEAYLLKTQKYTYDLLFKKDLPLGMSSEKILPLAPMPYPSNKEYFFKKEKAFNSIFFSGADRPNITRPDRGIICNYLMQAFPESKIFLNKPKLPNDLYEYLNQESLIQLSPCGRVWDSFRHCGAAIDSPILVIPKNDCELTWNIFRDEENCIIYDSKRLDKNSLNELKNKIKSVLDDPDLAMKIRKNYFNSIVENCSQLDASKYILEGLRGIN